MYWMVVRNCDVKTSMGQGCSKRSLHLPAMSNANSTCIRPITKETYRGPSMKQPKKICFLGRSVKTNNLWGLFPPCPTCHMLTMDERIEGGGHTLTWIYPTNSLRWPAQCLIASAALVPKKSSGRGPLVGSEYQPWQVLPKSCATLLAKKLHEMIVKNTCLILFAVIFCMCPADLRCVPTFIGFAQHSNI